jgi:hypothetical protein
MSSDSVRHLFPQLLRNGYVPLANRDKACWLPKWPDIGVDEEQCRRWTRQMRWPAIGLRVEPPLLVIDFDIPDAGILKAIEGITPSVVFDGLERIGNAPKTAFFLRMVGGEPFHKLSTHRYMFAGTIKPTFAVEAFSGGGGGKQIGSFGPHSHDEHGNVLRFYRWVGDRSPANVLLCDLPVMTREEVAAFLDEVDLLLAAWPGMVKDELSRRGESFQDHVYDLDHSTVFVDAEEFEYSLDELEAEAKARAELKQPQLRVTGSFTNDPLSSGSARCKVHWSKQHGVSVVDFKMGVTHHPVGSGGDPEVQQLFNDLFKNKGRA